MAFSMMCQNSCGVSLFLKRMLVVRSSACLAVDYEAPRFAMKSSLFSLKVLE